MQVLVVSSKTAIPLCLVVILLLPLSALAISTKKPEYLPPLPAAVDPSGYKPTPIPKPAPPASAGADSFGDSNYTSSDGAAQAPDRTKDLLRQALDLHNQGDLGGAERLFRQVLAIDPGNGDANFNLGAMAEDHGDLNGAARFYQAAARVSPGDKDIQDALSGIKNKIHQQQVAQQTETQVQQKLQLKQIAQDAADAYKAGRYDQAISDLNKIASQTPNDPNVQYGLGQAFRGQGDLNRAQQYLSRAAAIDPGNGLYRTTLSDLNQDIQHRSAVNDPAPAPDFRNRGHNSGDQFNNNDQGLRDYSQPPPQLADQSPAGQLTPFDNSDTGGGRLYGHAYGSGSGGMGLGSMLGMGGLGAGLGMLGGGSHYAGSGSRLVRRAALGSLAGAAVGALTNMHGAGGSKSGAMRGAVYGGLFSLMTGL